MKKSIFALAGIVSLFVESVFATDLSLRLMPDYNILKDTKLDSSFGGEVSLDFSPWTIRGRDEIFLSVQGGGITLEATGIKSMPLYDGGIALGYNYRPLDRITVGVEGNFGIYNVPKSKENNLEGTSGFSYGGKVSAFFNALPELSFGPFVGYKKYDSFIENLQIGLAFKYSFSKGLFGKSDLNVKSIDVDSIFPVFYSRYNDTPFGVITFVNNEKNDITDVEVSVYIERYMTNPQVCKREDRVSRGQSFTAELTAFLDETILTNLIAAKADARITISYKSLGKRMENIQFVELQTFSRNNMTWEDDRRAAAFVSSHDGSANFFANYVRSIVKPELRSSIPENIQYAAALFGALRAYGINYVIDPSSPFAANSGTAQVDFLQFPYQTLLYHGGDCDDLSILNCALLEALGIETAFITCPGHIFIAFDAGVSENRASAAGDCIVQYGKVWVPLEITLCQDSFSLERSTAMREWRKYPKERALIPLKEAWKEYKPVGIPDSSVRIEMPTKQEVLKGFRNNL